MNRFPIARSAEIVVQNLEAETLIYDLKINKALMLNQTSAFVWQQLDGQTSIADISRKLGAQFKQPANEEIVWLAIQQLKDNNLINDADHVASPLAGSTRREVIRRIGLATMIALPVISSLVAPPAANAASPVNLAACATCTSNNQCASGKCFQDVFPQNNRSICTDGSSSPAYPPGANVTASFVTQSYCLDTYSKNCCTGRSRFDSTGPTCFCT